MVPLTATIALVSTDLDGPWLVDATGVHDLPSPLPRAAAAIDSGGDLWLSGDPDIVWRGRWDPASSSLVGQVVLTSSVTLRKLAVTGTGTSAVIYGWQPNSGRFRRYRGGVWEELIRIPPPPGGLGRSAVLEAAPSGEVVLINNSSPNIVRVSESQPVTTESSPWPPEIPIGTSFVDGVGLLLGSSAGRVSVDPGDGQWHPLAASGDPTGVGVFTAYPDGFVAAGTGGELAQYSVTRSAFCAPQELVPFTIRQLIPLGGAMLAGGSNPTPDLMMTQIAIIRP
jgi:hypothetical protein